MNENDSIGYSEQWKGGIGRDLREKYLPFPGKFTMLPYLLNTFQVHGKNRFTNHEKGWQVLYQSLRSRADL